MIGKVRRVLGGKVLAAAFVLVLSACSATGGHDVHGGKQEGAAVSYTLGAEADIRALYPDASWLPQPYAAQYPDLAATVAEFTRQSLLRDGVSNAEVAVDFQGEGDARTVRVRITPVTATSLRYAEVHPRFLDAAHAQQALKGVAACKGKAGCWDPAPVSGEPWVPFLPLGLPMVNQETVLFLDYPPVPALTGKDYLNNFTMCRWGRVMGAAGVDNVLSYETIVDSRPIAAAGSGQDAYLPDPLAYFDDTSGAAGNYITPMLSLLAAGDATRSVRPVAVFGTAARNAWARIAGQSQVGVLDVGSADLGGQAGTVPWIATNHPDVTSYNCCPGDPDKRCGTSHALLTDESKDFIAACWLITMAETPGMTPDAARKACTTRWSEPAAAGDRQSLCVQAKLDNNNPAAVCASYEEAWNYCSAHAGNACATYDCKYDPAAVTSALPPPGQRPAGWNNTCNSYRE